MPLVRKSVYLLILAAASLGSLLLFAVVQPPFPASAPPIDFAGALRWLATHPADYIAAGTVAREALNTQTKRRFDVWHASHDLAVQLAPWRTGPRMSFVRSGLEHWYELPPRDRANVLRAAEPLLRDPEIFHRVAQPLFDLTANFGYLRRNAPHETASRNLLSRIAATNGLFADYRSLRSEAVIARLRRFSQIRSSASQADLIEILPDHFDQDDEPLLRSILDELSRRPLDAAPSDPGLVDRVVDYSLRHHIEPLSGLEALVDLPGAASEPSRARVALHLGDPDRASRIEISAPHNDPAVWADYFDDRAAFLRAHADTTMANLFAAKAFIGHQAREKWAHLCADNEICTTGDKEIVVAKIHPLSLTLEALREEHVPAYVELFLDDRRVAEGDVAKMNAFNLGTPAAGPHPIEIRIVNPFTPEARSRRLRIRSDAI
ncbi:MAG TPA: hypothetical protein VGJ81_02605 [Thermoanaerobaculia bacterium]|jgi:hypothetical protein